MRALLPPRLKLSELPTSALHRDYVTPIVHWQFDDTATTTIADRYTLSNLTNTTSADIVDAPLYKASATTTFGKGRYFNASSSASGAATATQRTRALAEWTAEAWIRLDSIATTHTIVALMGTVGDETSPHNWLLGFRIVNDEIQYVSESGAGTNIVASSGGGSIFADTLHHVAIRKRETPTAPGNYDIAFFVDGVLVGESLGNPNASGGGSASWYVGNENGGGTPLDGYVYEIRILAAAMPDEFVRDQAARGFRTWDEDVLYDDGNYAVHTRVLVEDEDDSDNFVDLDDQTGGRWPVVKAAEWGDDVDAAGASAKVMLSREVYDWSFAPGFADTTPVTGASGVPLLELARQIKIETAVVPLDVAPSDVPAWAWKLGFHGFISKIDWASPTITIDARDLIAPLQWTFIRPLSTTTPVAYAERVYGDDTTGVDVETVMQAIIDDHEPATGYKGPYPTIYTPTTPNWKLRRRALPFEPVRDGVCGKAEQIGYVCRYKWHDATQKFRLTFEEPDRAAASTVRTFGVHDYLALSEAAKNEDNIRNVCEVVYTDRLAGVLLSTGDYPRERYISSDATSIGKYGERYCQITEDANSQIDTATEAQLLADAVVADLKEPKALVTMDAHFLHFVELGDYYAVSANGLHFDGTQNLAVTGYRHTLSVAEDGKTARLRTVMNLRGLPAGKVDGWLDMIATPGTAPYNPFKPVEDPASVTTKGMGNGLVLVSWPFPVNYLNGQYDFSEIHFRDTALGGSWTPSSSTLKGVVRGSQMIVADLDPTKTYEIKILHRDRNRNVTSAVAGTSRRPRYIVESRPNFLAVASLGTEPSDVSDTLLEMGDEEFDDGSNYDPSAGNYKFVAPVAGRYHFFANIDMSTSELFILKLYKNGSRVRETEAKSDHLQMSTTITLAAGDYVQLYMRGSDAAVIGRVATTSYSSYWGGYLLYDT